MKKAKRSPVGKLKGEALVAHQALQALIAAKPDSAASQLRLLDLGIGEFAPRIPEVVLAMLDAAQPISVDDAKVRAGASKTSWQDLKATLELQLRLVRARAHWEDGDPQSAAEQFKQISASASSRRPRCARGGRPPSVSRCFARPRARSRIRWRPRSLSSTR